MEFLSTLVTFSLFPLLILLTFIFVVGPSTYVWGLRLEVLYWR